MPGGTRYPLDSYADPAVGAPVFRLRAKPEFSPLDINVAFLAQGGWNQSVDRLRFHVDRGTNGIVDHPLPQAINQIQPHLLIRRLDRDEDRLASLRINTDGEIVVL